MASKRRGNNEGSIFRHRNGTWRAQVFVKGKRVSFIADTKVECQQWIRKTLNQVDEMVNRGDSTLTLGEYLEQWLSTSRIGLRPSTIRNYERILRLQILPDLGLVQLNELNLARIERFYAGLLQKGFGPRTVRHTHSVLHRALERAVRYELLTRNPAHGASLPKYTPPEMKVLDESQVNLFLQAAVGSPYEGLYHLAIVTGMRQGELYGLRWEDLHWHTGELYVRRQAVQTSGGGWSFAELKTRYGTRVVKIGEATLMALRRHQERQKIQIALAGDRWQDNELIFPSAVGTPLHKSNMRKDFNQVLEKAGLPHIRFHDLRHTAASLMMNHKVPILVASRRLGHSKPSVTLDIYSHLYHESQDEVAQLLDELVTPVQVELPAVVKAKDPRGKTLTKQCVQLTAQTAHTR